MNVILIIFLILSILILVAFIDNSVYEGNNQVLAINKHPYDPDLEYEEQTVYKDMSVYNLDSYSGSKSDIDEIQNHIANDFIQSNLELLNEMITKLERPAWKSYIKDDCRTIKQTKAREWTKTNFSIADDEEINQFRGSGWRLKIGNSSLSDQIKQEGKWKRSCEDWNDNKSIRDSTLTKLNTILDSITVNKDNYEKIIINGTSIKDKIETRAQELHYKDGGAQGGSNTGAQGGSNTGSAQGGSNMGGDLGNNVNDLLNNGNVLASINSKFNTDGCQLKINV